MCNQPMRRIVAAAQMGVAPAQKQLQIMELEFPVTLFVLVPRIKLAAQQCAQDQLTNIQIVNGFLLTLITPTLLANLTNYKISYSNK